MNRKLILLLLTTFLLMNCGQGGEAGFEPAEYAKMESGPASEADFQYAADEARMGEGAGQQPLPAANVERKIIRTADISLEVEKYAEGRHAVGELIDRYQAEITSEEEHKYAYRIENRLTIRIAPEKLDSFVLELEVLAFHVDSKSIRAEDVTRQYVDLETRLEAKRATVERYREILRTARNVQEVLAVEENLRKVIEEIESTERQLRYLRDQVQQSTVNLLIYEEFDQPEVRRKNFFQRLGHAFADGWQVFLNLVVGLISIWPVILILVVVLWLLARWVRRRRK